MSEKKPKKIVAKILSILMLGVFAFTPLALAQEETAPEETLYEPIEKQIIQLADPQDAEGWNISALETYGLKLLIRGKEALTWSLNIEDGGFHNPAIEASYIKVLTIVNSFFILGLLAIALMWMFSILIPRKYLKKVILIYSMAVIFVNFALPLNRLFIDGTNLLQRTLLTSDEGNLGITDIVQTPDYTEAVSYRSPAETSEEALKLRLDGPAEEKTAIGSLSSASLDESGNPVSEEILWLDNRALSIYRNGNFTINGEQTVFRFLLILFTALAYFIIALIFVLRIIILWALLILSPLLLLLSIFRSTRGWFFNWLGMYGRWLFIGPLTALGIAITVNIWQLSGLPISVSEGYSPEVFTTESVSNIVFYLPGKDTANTLSNTQEMMEYIIFLLMLYLPIFLGFTLTRQKVLQGTTSAITKKLVKSSQVAQQQLIQQALSVHDEESREKDVGIVDSFRNLVNEKIGLITETAMPLNKIKSEPEHPVTMMPTASNFLPDNLKETPLPKMLELLGRRKDSKSSHHSVIEKLAMLERIQDSKERENVASVMNEIQHRAEEGNQDALNLLHEVETLREVSMERVEGSSVQSAHAAASGHESGSNINIHVNDREREEDRKVRDSSFDSKSEKKGEKGRKRRQRRKHKKDNKKEKNDIKAENKPEKNSNPNENAD